MKKRKLKLLALPLAVASASVIGMVSGTLAYFTSQDKATVSIEAGQVKISYAIDDTSLATSTTFTSFTDDGDFENGGSATITGLNSLSIEKMTPGDIVEFDINVLNESNVDIKYKFESLWNDIVKGIDPDGIVGRKGLSEAIVFTATDVATSQTVFTDDYVNWSYSSVAADMTKKMHVKLVFPVGLTDNGFQGAQSTLTIGLNAIQQNADTFTMELNDILAKSAAKNPTMYDALKEVNVTASVIDAKGLVWDSVNDKFIRELEINSDFYKYFKVYDAMPATQTFSIYAKTFSNVTTVALDGIGFDAGDVTGIETISYVNNSGAARTVIVRSNDGALSVNADSDTVNHYNFLDELTIYAVDANHSYHEYGTVAEARLVKGKLVVEKPGFIGNLVDSGSEAKAIAVEGVVMEAETTTDITGGGSYPGQTAEVEKVIKVSTFDQFQGLANLCNKGVTFEGYTIQLQADIDFKDKVWTPFGRYVYRKSQSYSLIVLKQSAFFMGSIDGNGHKITNFSNVGYDQADVAYDDATNPSRIASNYGLVMLATGDVTIKNLEVNFDFEAVDGQTLKSVGLIGYYFTQELDPVAKVVWEDDEWVTYNNPRFNRATKEYQIKEAFVKFQNVKTTGTITCVDGTAAYIGTNYVTGHPQIIDDNGVYEWRSYKWCVQSKDVKIGDSNDANQAAAKAHVENYVKTAGSGWYTEPIVHDYRGDDPVELNYVYKGEYLDPVGDLNCVGYAPLRVTYTYEDCVNTAKIIATEQRAGVFFGKFSNSSTVTNMADVNFVRTVNSGNIETPKSAGVISASLNGSNVVTVNITGITNTGTVTIGSNVYEGAEALMPH